MTPRFCLIILLALAAAAPAPAWAKRRIYSYDSANPLTEKMTESGLTFIFDKTPLSQRVQRILETHDIGSAELKPSSDRDLGPGGLASLIGPGAHERDLYEISGKDDGRALINALCRGADRAWLAFGQLAPERSLRVHAIGHDPKTGQARLCVTLDYNFHGEWALPPPELPQPDRSDRFNTAPQNRPY
jgi:hypothetical protein